MRAADLFPASLRGPVTRTVSRLKYERYRLIPVRRPSGVDNVFHCCVQKTASQWIRKIFSSVELYRYSGLRPFHYQTLLLDGYDRRRLCERAFSDPFPRRTVVTPLYVDFASYRSIPKPMEYRTFFVLRDPRDVVVSSYYSAKYSHPVMGNVDSVRETLRTCSEEDGLLRTIDSLRGFGLFDAVASWVREAASDPSVILVRFEDLIGPQSAGTFATCLTHLDILVPTETLQRVLERHSFRRLSGRNPGVEKASSHYRRGVAGDWRRHFTARVAEHFESAAGDLVSRAGYAS